MPNPDFTKGVPIPEGASQDWNLGATGARGWMHSNKLATIEARQVYITKVVTGSPADGVLKVGDVLLGVAGKAFSHDSRQEIGRALTVFLSEYILATGDKSVLPGLRRIAMEASSGQSRVGSWGHRFAAPDGRLYGCGTFTAYDDLPPDILLELLGSWSPIVRARVSSTLARRKDITIEPLIKLLDDPSVEARLGACEALAAFKEKAAPACRNCGTPCSRMISGCG